MAVTDDGITVPQSTGAVAGPPATWSHEQVADNASTGAVDAPAPTVETRFGPSGQKPSGAVPNPEPTTHVNPVVKVVNGPERQQPRGATTAETTNTGSVRAQKAAHAADDTTADGGR